ncbi:hypothetical protein [Domibacillus aminovorans]|uniref:DUF4386 domain-containing protein n=1 Tax=Domibacillus aminovorans TaxID=29332 RepID=A0A177L7X3_9BACI|nr:hypothetical protein [Domibacillus aminovorans]OAH61486.1 hypothetical protein AWH49_12850 [Domibacillus aminovorans]
MPFPTKVLHIYLSATSLVISGILFVLYPALRPFSDETSMEGATAFASTEWLVAHMLAIVAFTLLPLGLLGLHNSLQGTARNSLTNWAFVLCLVGIGLVLPFYGGETFGLHAIGQEAIRQQSAELVSLANIVRSGAGLVMFLIGLLLLGIATILFAIAIWRSGKYPKWSGLPFAFGMCLYIPQFFVGQPLRVVHGLLVAIGCIWIAIDLWKSSNQNISQKA